MYCLKKHNINYMGARKTSLMLCIIIVMPPFENTVENIAFENVDSNALFASLAQLEIIWHNEINAILSLDFWKHSYKLVTNIKFENKMKWLQYGIIISNHENHNNVFWPFIIF